MKEVKNRITEANERRMKAEAQLQFNQTKVEGIVNYDTQKLLHELQVHQIELEMQNEELQEANLAAEKALRKYTVLYDFAPAGYLTLTREGIITDLNFTAAEMLAHRRIDLINSSFRIFVAESMRSSFNDFMRKAFDNFSREKCEILINDANNVDHFIHIEGIAIEEDNHLLLSLFDISKFNRAALEK